MDSHSILHETVVTKPNIKFSGTTETLVFWLKPDIFQKLKLTNTRLISWKTK